MSIALLQKFILSLIKNRKIRSIKIINQLLNVFIEITR